MFAALQNVATSDDRCESFVSDQKPGALDRLLGSQVSIHRKNQNMIAIVAVRPNVVLG
jgi:hypothetical protein